MLRTLAELVLLVCCVNERPGWLRCTELDIVVRKVSNAEPSSLCMEDGQGRVGV